MRGNASTNQRRGTSTGESRAAATTDSERHVVVELEHRRDALSEQFVRLADHGDRAHPGTAASRASTASAGTVARQS